MQTHFPTSPRERAARITFWMFLGTLALVATVSSFPVVPTWVVATAMAVTAAAAAAFAIALIRLPERFLRSWVMVAAMGLLLGFITFSI